MTTHNSFAGLTEEGFKTHAADTLEHHATASERKQALAYLSTTLTQDAVAIDAEVKALFKRRRLGQKHKKSFEALLPKAEYDYSKTADVFTLTTKTDAQIAALLTNDDVDVSIGTRVLTTDIAFTGNDCTLVGTGATGSAVDGTLVCSCKIIGNITLGAQRVTIKGIHFHATVDSGGNNQHITHTAACTGYTFENCIFTSDAGAYATRQWFWGAGGFYSGNLTIRNCQIGKGDDGYGSWGIADINTGSSHTVTTLLGTIEFDRNLFLNNAGSIAVRGNPASPNLLGKFTGNVFRMDAGKLLHAYFWAVIEFNNFNKVLITDNTVACPKLVGDDNCFVQTWSKAKYPWVIRYRGNNITGFNVGISIPCAAGFYAPHHNASDFSIAHNTHTDVDNEGSWLWDSNLSALVGTYAPENADPFDHIPHGLTSGTVLGPDS